MEKTRAAVAKLKADEEDFKGYKITVIQKKAINPKDVIPKNIMEEIDSVYNQKKLNPFFQPTVSDAIKTEASRILKVQQVQVGSSQLHSPAEAELVPPSQNAFIAQQLEMEQGQKDRQDKPSGLQNPVNQSSVEELIGKAATRLSKDIGAGCIVSVEKAQKESQDFNFFYVKAAMFKKTAKNVYTKLSYTTRMRKQLGGSTLPVRELLMEAVNRHFINKGERIVCVADESLGMGYKGLIFVIDVDKIFFNMSIHNLREKINSDVLEALLSIAMELVSEGREGRKIGTAFIVGDAGEMSKYARQLIINPFQNYPAEMRQITDPDIKETIKGFSQLDGAFFVDANGTVLSAGTQINLDLGSVQLEGLEGFGTRHRYSAAITKLTNSIAVVVSESGGTVRVFKEGKIVMKLP
ncbi:MAG: diadenylate cyclase [Nanoarchaeota archaeon]